MPYDIFELIQQKKYNEILALAKNSPMSIFNDASKKDDKNNNIFHHIAKQHSTPYQFVGELFAALDRAKTVTVPDTDPWLMAKNKEDESFYSICKGKDHSYIKQLNGHYSSRNRYFNKQQVSIPPSRKDTSHAIT